MEHKEYNGWTNYETWVVALWMDNEQGTQEYWLERATEYVERHDDAGSRRFLFADELRDHHTEALPESEGFVADLLNAAMSEVNWGEIASKFIADAVENGAECQE